MPRLFCSLLLVTALVGCQASETAEPAADAPAATSEAAPTTETAPAAPDPTAQLQIEDVSEGSGMAAQNGDMVIVHYTGKLPNGTVFDSSVGRQPIRFVLGRGEVIPGWDQGLLGLKVGGKRKLTIPPHLGYGASGSGPIPPNATLLFDVELVDIARR
jgi:peptidylprolyl isomerase